MFIEPAAVSGRKWNGIAIRHRHFAFEFDCAGKAAAADKPRTAVYCPGSIPYSTSAARQNTEFDANNVMHNNVNPNNRMSRLSLLLMVFGGEDREGISGGKETPFARGCF